jgi:hypothetical protein
MSLLALFILIVLPFILLLSESTGPHELDFSLDPIEYLLHGDHFGGS